MKKIKIAATLVIGVFSFQSFNAQESKMKCGTEVPSQQWEDAFQKQITEFVANKTASKSQQAYTIPVIIHVIHGNQPVGSYPNLAQGQLNSQIQVLNNDYGGTGYNSTNYPQTAFAAWAATAGVAPASLDGNNRVAIANTNIQFCLATQDPNGVTLTEPGIHRVNYNTMGWTNPGSLNSYNAFKNYMDGTIKPGTIWDVTRYLNIWVSDVNLNATGGLLGYATFPPSSGLTGVNFASGTATTDGFWSYAQVFGSVNIYPSGTYMAGYTRGRTSTHEIGHWLGLRHIWGDGTCATDYCADTPRAQDENFNAPSYPYNVNLCSGSGNGEMFMNFMDYTNDNAKYMFTTDQANRMQTAMANSPYRNLLGTHNLCSVSSVAANASFASSSMGCTGLSMNLTNSSTGWPPPSYTWTSSGGVFSPNAQAQSPSISFPAPGIYTITLTSNNGTVSVYNKTVTITSPTLYMSALSQTVCEGKAATFYANGVDSYTWQPGNIMNAIATFTPSSTQNYTCTGAEINNCKTATVVEVVVSPCTGIEAYSNEGVNVSVYPNPAHNVMNVQVDAALHTDVVVEVCDAIGRKILSENLQLSSTSYVHTIDVAGFDKGIYFVKVTTPGVSVKTVKFVKD